MNSAFWNMVLSPMWAIKNHRHLLKEFVFRDVKGRFAGSMAGMLWTLLNPLSTIIVYFFIFSIIFRIKVNEAETGTSSFVIFFLSGYFPWLLFSEALMRSVGILIENTNMITKVVFPVELLPTSSVLSTLMINGFGLLFFLLYLVYQHYLHPSWLFIVVLFLGQQLFTFGLAYFLAALCVFVRDIKELLSIIIMIWFHVTPIIYPISLVPAAARPVLEWNPMTIFVLLYRETLLLHHIHTEWVIRMLVMSVLSYVLGAWFFMRTRSAFGDVL